MNVSDLLSNSPDLLNSIKEVGVPTDKVGGLTDAIGKQLGGGLDLGDLLGGLDANSFMGKLDIPALSQQVGISPDIVQKAVEMIGPKVEEFVPGGLGGLASKFFGK